MLYWILTVKPVQAPNNCADTQVTFHLLNRDPSPSTARPVPPPASNAPSQMSSWRNAHLYATMMSLLLNRCERFGATAAAGADPASGDGGSAVLLESDAPPRTLPSRNEMVSDAALLILLSPKKGKMRPVPAPPSI